MRFIIKLTISNPNQARKMKNELEEIESQVMLYTSKARKMTADLEEVEAKVDHAETALNVIWGK